MRASPSYVWRWAWLAASAGSLCASAASPEVSQLIGKFQGEESGFVDHVEIANEIAKVATLDDVSSLEPWLAHEDRHVRGNAAYLFAKLGDRRGLATIEGILTDYSADRHVRWQGGSLIFQGNGEEAMAEFLRSPAALDAQISQDRYYAVHLLGELRDPRAVDVLIPLLDRDEVNYKVAWALGEIGEMRAVPALIAALSNEDPLVRVTSIGALENLRAVRALPYLVSLFDDPAVPSAGEPGIRRNYGANSSSILRSYSNRCGRSSGASARAKCLGDIDCRSRSGAFSAAEVFSDCRCLADTCCGSRSDNRRSQAIAFTCIA